MRGRRKNTLESVWKNIKRSRNGCWVWQGSTNASGYGRITINYRDCLVHRVVYTLVHGDPGDLAVLHHCDNPPCCRPDHLYAGTAQDNSDDRDSRGRGNAARGERHGMARLSDADAAEIRRRCNNGEKQKDLAVEYGISRAQVSRIVNRKRRQN